MKFITIYEYYEQHVTRSVVIFLTKKDIQQKIKFAQIFGILKNTFKPNLLQTFSKIKAYNTLDLPILLYGSEISNLREKIKMMASIEMTFFSTTNLYTLFDHKKYEEILEELKVGPAGEN